MAHYAVTGGAGFIGSHITEELLKSGNSVTVLDNFFSGKKENLAFLKEYEYEGKLKVIEGDIRNIDDCMLACEGASAVFHQAALRSVPKSMENPYEYNDVNINGTLNMLRAAEQKELKRFVFASSSSVYGDTDVFPESEDAYPLLISPYALSKLAGEFYLRIYACNYDLETIALRYFNVYGPRQALDDEYAVVIPKFITCIINDEKPPVFGNGKQSRDFTFVKDVVRANINAATIEGLGGDVFNVAGGRSNTLLELIDIVNRIAGKSIEPDFLPIRKGDVFKTVADMKRVTSKLKFTPSVTFEEGLRITFDFFKNKVTG